MKLGFLFRNDLSIEESELVAQLGAAVSYTANEIYVTATDGNDIFAAAYLEEGGKHLHHLTKGLFDTCDRVYLYVSDDTIEMIDSRDGWGTAKAIRLDTTRHLQTMAFACTALAAETSSNTHMTTNPSPRSATSTAETTTGTPAVPAATESS